MPIWKRIVEFFWPRRGAPRTFHLDEGLVRSLDDLAQREQRRPDELAVSLLEEALMERGASDLRMQRWRDLTPREQQVAALICLNYTTGQIAARLAISPETVKSHAHNALYKLGVRNRQELRRALARWDFSDWDDAA